MCHGSDCWGREDFTCECSIHILRWPRVVAEQPKDASARTAAIELLSQQVNTCWQNMIAAEHLLQPTCSGCYVRECCLQDASGLLESPGFNALTHTNSCTMNTMLRQMPLYTHSTQATSARHVHAQQARCRAGAPAQDKLQQQHSRLQDLQDALSSEQEQGAGPQPLSRVVQELNVTNEIMQVSGAGFCESCAMQCSHTASYACLHAQATQAPVMNAGLYWRSAR